MNMKKMPVLFISHGSPFQALDQNTANDYRKWSSKLTKPKAILVFSAHWESAQLSLGERSTHSKLIYDFFGFPEELYNIKYPAPGSSWLAGNIKTHIGDTYDLVQTERGLDHGVWIPIKHMWPKADIAILQMSIPRSYSNQQLIELGNKLEPLRKQGVLIITSGSITHNLQQWDPRFQGAVVSSAEQFDSWVKKILLQGDINELVNWQTNAPYADFNHPTPEHFRPLLIAAGANNLENVSFPIEGFEAGIFSKRSLQFN